MSPAKVSRSKRASRGEKREGEGEGESNSDRGRTTPHHAAPPNRQRKRTNKSKTKTRKKEQTQPRTERRQLEVRLATRHQHRGSAEPIPASTKRQQTDGQTDRQTDRQIDKTKRVHACTSPQLHGGTTAMHLRTVNGRPQHNNMHSQQSVHRQATSRPNTEGRKHAAIKKDTRTKQSNIPNTPRATEP